MTKVAKPAPLPFAPDLRPCPFCKSGLLTKFSNVHGRCLYVYCNDCGARGPLNTREHDGVVMWNTREAQQ